MSCTPPTALITHLAQATPFSVPELTTEGPYSNILAACNAHMIVAFPSQPAARAGHGAAFERRNCIRHPAGFQHGPWRLSREHNRQRRQRRQRQQRRCYSKQRQGAQGARDRQAMSPDRLTLSQRLRSRCICSPATRKERVYYLLRVLLAPGAILFRALVMSPPVPLWSHPLTAWTPFDCIDVVSCPHTSHVCGVGTVV